ncbi:MAG TPA: 1-(5-phosphoribosyl)-5-[(5-phosphoribosylamino)methylideneamino]imidazole-4-carboxamide isomerase [Rhodospirillales bacterium]|nr:1-(5-phosphoribosyl)-5-[(5-phosphoribosylamino)methylideneamino]imidazole-4-carboxamide isomerase [Rhodospirillales bacterium]
MIFYPAIDLKDGACVRLVRGEMASATVFNADPAAQAREFAAAGCRWIHVVDLNGAFAGKPVNAAAVATVVEAAGIPVQLGGGIRDMATIARWLENGVSRVVLGTAAVRTPALVDEACRAYPGRIAVGIDARDGEAAIEGWAEPGGIAAIDLARRFQDAGVAAIVYTDISRDGAMEGPNIAATLALARTVASPVIASGGVSSMADLRALKAAGGNTIAGVICGRALYDGSVDPAAAVALLEAEGSAGMASAAGGGGGA